MQEMEHPLIQFLLPWKRQHQPCLPSSYPPTAANAFCPLCPTAANSRTHSHALSMQKVPVSPSSPSLSHPAPQKDHGKSLHHPCRGSSPGNTTGESPHGKTEGWAMQPAEGELPVPFGVTHTCHSISRWRHSAVGDEEPKRTHFPLYKDYCSALTFCSLQILCFTGNNSPPASSS